MTQSSEKQTLFCIHLSLSLFHRKKKVQMEKPSANRITPPQSLFPPLYRGWDFFQTRKELGGIREKRVGNIRCDGEKRPTVIWNVTKS